MTTFDPRTVHSMTGQQFGTRRNDTPPFGNQGFPGQQFPGPVPPPPTRPSRKRPMAAKIVTGMVAASLLVGGAGTWIALSGSSTEVAVQSTSFAGDNPTTSPFGTDAPDVSTVAATGPQSGGTPAMYASTDPASCDNADFLSQIQADPAKAAGFAGVFRIGADEVPAFVKSLSPVVLRAATAVTDHPFTDGAFVEQPAVLAAGTAVLVNSYGEPTVKCFNGNPLTAGIAAPGAVTVDPTPRAISTFQFTSIDNSKVITVQTPPDPKHDPGPNPPPLTARYNYDGTVLTSDGRLIDKDGKVIAPKATIPPGGFHNADGSITVNGKVFNPDGTERKAILVPAHIEIVNGVGSIVPARTIGVDGVLRDGAGKPVVPQPQIIRNYDGTATVIKGNRVEVRNADGSSKTVTAVNPPDKINKDGSITKGDGTIVNPDGTTKRDEVPLPDGTKEKPNGGDTFAGHSAKNHLNPDGSLPAGAVKNADGTISLKDGTVLNPDGTEKGEVQPDGSIKFKDGSVKLPDGTVLNPDGTVKAPKVVPNGGVITPNGTGTIPGNTSIPCGAVADSAGSECKVPSGSADSTTGTTPAAGTTPATGTGSTGTGSTRTGSTGTGSSSSSGSGSSSGGTSSSSTGGGSPSSGSEGADK
jgi:hypothetical protein